MEPNTETPAPKGAKGKSAEKPVMAAKKEFTLPAFQVVDEVPVPMRTNTQARLPIGFDELYEAAKKAKKPVMRFIPVGLWESRGIEAAKITAAANKDRLRRAFYGWQGKEEVTPDRHRYTLAFSDQVDGKQKYTGTNLYFTLKPTP